MLLSMVHIKSSWPLLLISWMSRFCLPFFFFLLPLRTHERPLKKFSPRKNRAVPPRIVPPTATTAREAKLRGKFNDNDDGDEHKKSIVTRKYHRGDVYVCKVLSFYGLFGGDAEEWHGNFEIDFNIIVLNVKAKKLRFTLTYIASIMVQHFIVLINRNIQFNAKRRWLRQRLLLLIRYETRAIHIEIIFLHGNCTK